MSFRCLRIALPAGALLAAGLCGVRAADPLTTIQDGVQDVLAEVYDRAGASEPLSARVRPIIERHFDLNAITRRAVGRPWLNFTPEDQERVIDLFSELVLRTYADSFDPGERPTVDYGQPVELDAKRVELPTTITYAGQAYAVSYRMVLGGDGAWRIYDVIIEGVSMVSNYRSQFDAIVQKGGAAQLILMLEKNLRDAAVAP